MADKLNTAAANKLLKLLEEPTEKTVILISENEEDIIQTIRLDVKYFISMDYRSQYRRSLSFEKNIDPKIALKIAHQAQEISTKHCNYCNPIANLF
jgi:DNA polymerase-3 subunit delta'